MTDPDLFFEDVEVIECTGDNCDEDCENFYQCIGLQIEDRE